MERLLSVWLQDQCQCQVPLSLMLIQQEDQCLYEDLRKKLKSQMASFNAILAGFISSRLEPPSQSKSGECRWQLPINFLKYF